MKNKKTDIMPEVDFFKGLAIIMVIFVHYAQIFNLPVIIKKIPMFFQMGCQIFFVLSAFTLCISYEKNKPKYFSFLKKRISKLYNGYWFMVFVFCLIRIFSSHKSISLINAINPFGVITNLLFLNGLVPIPEINNRIVYGGWFVGTIVILYALFPLLYKLFSNNNKYWDKLKLYIFPFIIFCVTSLLLIICLYAFNLKIENNSFIYFSFLNQLSCFSIGFCLYKIYKDIKFESINFPFIKGILLLLVSIFLFYKNYECSFVLLPFVFGLSFMYIYIFYKNIKSRYKKTLIIEKIFEKFGKCSLTIYLTQSIVIFYIFPYIRAYLINYLPETRIYFLLIPFVYIVAYIFGKILTWIIEKLSLKEIYKLIKKERGNLYE